MIDMKSFKELAHDLVTKVDEDAPANAVGTGANVALPPAHKPGVKKKKKKKHDPILINNLKRKVQENNDNNSMMLKGVLDKLEQLDDIVDEVSGVKKEIIGQVEETPQYTTFKDKYMGQMLNESSTAAAKEMEYILVKVAGGTIPPAKSKFTNLTPYAIKNGFKTVDDLGKECLKNAGLQGRSGQMVDNQPVSAEWEGENTTPKTDIKIDGKKISLKKGASQLMSGGPAESRSTFNTAAKASGLDKAMTDLAKECQDGIEELLGSTLGTQKGGKDAQVKAGTFQKDKVLVKADKFNQELKVKFANLFEQNPNFKREFVYEAMTGKVKFNDNEGTADHFMVVDFDGTANFYPVASSKAQYVKKILSNVNPDVKFKSTSQKKTVDGVETKTGKYRFWSVVGLGYKAAAEKTEELMNEVNSGELEYLSEGFFDRVKSIIKSVGDIIKNAFTQAIKYLMDKASNFAEFLGLQPQIRFNNTVKW